MILGFKTELKLNNRQRTACLKHAGVARHAWNQALCYTKLILDVRKLQKEAGLEQVKFPSAIDLHKWLVANVKSEFGWYYESSKSAPQNALRDLRVAWDRCFKKIAKPLRFKKKGKHDSFTLDGSTLRCEHNRIKVPNIGWLRTHERLPSGYKPKSVTISRDGQRWFISFKLEVEPQSEITNRGVVGVDLGIKTFATTSYGEEIKAPIEQYKRLKAKISKLQYLARNKERGSKRCCKTMDSIQRIHYRVKCLRRDFIHKFTTRLCKENSVVCMEDLAVGNMMKNHKLADAIAMQAWYETRRQLEYKAKLYCSELRVVGRFEPTSKTHAKCGWKNTNLSLKDRVFYCPHCEESVDRDWNAAINILKVGFGFDIAKDFRELGASLAS